MRDPSPNSTQSGVGTSTRTTLSARNLSMAYGGIRALDGVSLDLVSGEIHGLCGENGAGKSTFIKILGGLVKPISGEIDVDGTPLTLGRPTDPEKVSIVHQELAIVPTISVLDNITLCMRSGLAYLRDTHRPSVRANLDAVGLNHVHLDTPAGTLSLAERQLVEIARGITRNARVLLLDEPTATLSDAEIRRVFEVTRRLRDGGTSLIFVSHRLDEVFELTDRVTVLRNGLHILTERTKNLTSRELVRAMLGRELTHSTVNRRVAPSDERPRLALRNFAVPGRVEASTRNLSPARSRR